MTTKNLFFTGLFTLSLLTGFQSIARPGDLLTMRTTESQNGRWNNSLKIVDETGKTEEVALKKLSPEDYAPNQIVITETLNKLKAKGYKLLTIAQGNAEGLVTVTYVSKNNR